MSASVTPVLEHYGLPVATGLVAVWLVPQLRLQVISAGLLLLIIAGALVVLSAPVPTAQPSTATTAGAINWGAAPASVARWRALIEQMPECQQFDPALIAAILWQESAGDPGATSFAGAKGLMQIATGDPRAYDPAWSVRAGCLILTQKVRIYGGPAGVWRYNGAPDTQENARFRRGVADKYVRLALEPVRFRAYPLDPMPRIAKSFNAPAPYQIGGRHTGIDVAGPDGATLYAVADGVVTYVGPLYCNRSRICRGDHAVMVEVAPQVYAIYSHNSAALVTPGQRVTAGQPVARQGNEGYSSGSHLHFEVHVGAPFSGNWRAPFKGGKFVDPMTFFG